MFVNTGDRLNKTGSPTWDWLLSTNINAYWRELVLFFKSSD